MSEMVERVARAIKADLGRQWSAVPAPGGASDANDWTATGGVLDLEQVARASIAAMREPTMAMLGSAMDYWPEHDDPPTPPEDYWQAMIDAALAEGEK